MSARRARFTIVLIVSAAALVLLALFVRASIRTSAEIRLVFPYLSTTLTPRDGAKPLELRAGSNVVVELNSNGRSVDRVDLYLTKPVAALQGRVVVRVEAADDGRALGAGHLDGAKVVDSEWNPIPVVATGSADKVRVISTYERPEAPQLVPALWETKQSVTRDARAVAPEGVADIQLRAWSNEIEPTTRLQTMIDRTRDRWPTPVARAMVPAGLLALMLAAWCVGILAVRLLGPLDGRRRVAALAIAAVPVVPVAIEVLRLR